MVDQTESSAAEDNPWPPTTYAWYVVIVLGLSNILSLMDRMVVSFLLGPISEELALSDTAASLLVGAAFTIFYCFMGLPIARMADSKSRKYIIMIGVSLWSLMTALCGAAQSFVQFFLARMGVGIGSATLSPSAYSIMADYFPPQKLALPVGVFSAGVSVGMGFAFIGGAAAIAVLLSY